MIREAVVAYLSNYCPDTQPALDEAFVSLPVLQLPSRDEWDRDPSPAR
jgi:hypothetical protein